MRGLSMIAAFGATAVALAQGPAAPDPLVQARGRLQKALATTAALPSCAFTARWGPDEKAQKAGQPANAGNAGNVVVVMGTPFGAAAPGTASGAWSADLLHLQADDGEFLFAGRRMLARDQGQDWVLRRSRSAAGADAGFLPDPQLLLDLLARMPLAVVHRDVGARQDRPVELLTVALNQDQVAELAWNGALPAGAASSLVQNLNVRVAGLGAAGGRVRAAPQKPDATVDVCLAIDPGTGLVHGLHFRCYGKGGLPGGIVRIQGANGGLAVQNQGGDEESEDEPARELRYEDGLPVRPRTKVTVTDYVLDLKDHGSAKVPAPDETARALLGR